METVGPLESQHHEEDGGPEERSEPGCLLQFTPTYGEYDAPGQDRRLSLPPEGGRPLPLRWFWLDTASPAARISHRAW